MAAPGGSLPAGYPWVTRVVGSQGGRWNVTAIPCARAMMRAGQQQGRRLPTVGCRKAEIYGDRGTEHSLLFINLKVGKGCDITA